jgi:hypothetical protein
MNPLFNVSTEDLLERIETNAILYMQTGEERFFDNVQSAKKEILRRVNSKDLKFFDA